MSKNFDDAKVDNFTNKSQLQQQVDLAELQQKAAKKKAKAKISFDDIKPLETKSKVVSLKIKPSTYDNAFKKAKKQGFKSFNSFVNELLEAYAQS